MSWWHFFFNHFFKLWLTLTDDYHSTDCEALLKDKSAVRERGGELLTQKSIYTQLSVLWPKSKETSFSLPCQHDILYWNRRLTYERTATISFFLSLMHFTGSSLVSRVSISSCNIKIFSIFSLVSAKYIHF